ncbi:HET-domain-containing protein [Daldinia bambusicola]|nr:HET-domain-containing protein [Daldinia bambusicola]
MRLINTATKELEEFFDDSIPSKYAVLSHRWGNDEVTFQEWIRNLSDLSKLSSRQGYRKIASCCEQAREDDIEWVWVDTCCIDKTSSQELSEAINSMFAWYQNSSCCYVYLHDYHQDEFHAHSLRSCEWFFRGWTLQELIAPHEVVFYNSEWQSFGAKSDDYMYETISEITGIDSEFLLKGDLESASIAKKMSWASNRKTSRVEDMAYSLLGIFDINIPLLYGEGPKAFRRLQEEIMKTYPSDHSLFAWGTPVEKCSIEVPDDNAWLLLNGKDEDWPASPGLLYGLFASSPKDFQDSRNYSPHFAASWYYTSFFLGGQKANYPMILGKGLGIELPVIRSARFCCRLTQPRMRQVRHGNYAVLLCQDDTDNCVMLCIPLIKWGLGYTARPKELLVVRISEFAPSFNYLVHNQNREFSQVIPEKNEIPKHGSIIVRSIDDIRPRRYFNTYLLDTDDGTTVSSYTAIHPSALDTSRSAMIVLERDDVKDDWAIILGRVNAESANLPLLQVGIALLNPDNDFKNEWRTADFLYHKLFESPLEEFRVDHEGLPTIHIQAERHMLPKKGEFIDAIEILVRDKAWMSGDIAFLCSITPIPTPSASPELA